MLKSYSSLRFPAVFTEVFTESTLIAGLQQLNVTWTQPLGFELFRCELLHMFVQKLCPWWMSKGRALVIHCVHELIYIYLSLLHPNSNIHSYIYMFFWNTIIMLYIFLTPKKNKDATVQLIDLSISRTMFQIRKGTSSSLFMKGFIRSGKLQ